METYSYRKAQGNLNQSYYSLISHPLSHSPQQKVPFLPPELDGQPVQKNGPAKMQQNEKAIHYQPG